MKTFNLVASVVTATLFAAACFQMVAASSDQFSGWVLAAAWLTASVVWAAVFSLVRDGVRPTLTALRRR